MLSISSLINTAINKIRIMLPFTFQFLLISFRALPSFHAFSSCNDAPGIKSSSNTHPPNNNIVIAKKADAVNHEMLKKCDTPQPTNVSIVIPIVGIRYRFI